MDNKLYFPVEDVSFYDLADWLPHLRSCKPKMTIGKVHRRKRVGNKTSTNLHLIALFRVGDTVYATDEKCPHAGGPLDIGDIEVLPDRSSVCVRCPWHNWRFNLETGENLAHTRKDVKLNVYPTKVDHKTGKISVGFDAFHSSFFTGEF